MHGASHFEDPVVGNGPDGKRVRALHDLQVDIGIGRDGGVVNDELARSGDGEGGGRQREYHDQRQNQRDGFPHGGKIPLSK